MQEACHESASRLRQEPRRRPTRPLLALQVTVDKSGIEKSLLELVKIRASPGYDKCAFCLHMHTRDAQEGGRERGAHLCPRGLARIPPLYTERERAALAWTEALTLLPETNASEGVYDAGGGAAFPSPRSSSLTLAIGAINLWNRFGVGFRHAAPAQGAAGGGVSC